jgi:tripartite-type tricarboxylate transporter receptor subunit TctC
MMKMISTIVLSILSLWTVGVPLSAQAQSFPSKPIRLIVPFPPGGPNDVIARAVVDVMREHLGQPIVVENRAGAAGVLGSDAGAKAAPDGYTLTLGSTSTHSLPTLLGQKIPYDPKTSFVPIGLIGQVSTVLAISTKVPANNFKEFVDYAKKNPGKLSYGSSGVGTLNHLAAESFKLETQTFIVHVPYRGTGQAMTDLIGGQIDVLFDAVTTARPQAEAGKIKVLASGGNNRAAGLPQLQTLQEFGLRGFDASLWIGILAPAGTPRDFVQKLNDALTKSLRQAALSERLMKMGVVVTPGADIEMANYMQASQTYWKKIVTMRDIKVE